MASSLVNGPAPNVGSAVIFRVPVTSPPGDIAVTVYTPTEAAIRNGGLATDNGRLPTVVDYHGGGFVLGGMAADDSWCRQICESVGCVVVNVDYRLAPQYIHPTPAEDAWDAFRWIVAEAPKLRVDVNRLAVAGLSAGGCLAAVIALRARDDATMPSLVLQLLIVPVIDARYMPTSLEAPAAADCPYESYHSCRYAPMLPLARLIWFYNLWLGTDPIQRPALAASVTASPITAASHAGLAPASIHAAEIDPLNSEAGAYHELLRSSGVESELTIYKGCGHTFAHWDGRVTAGRTFTKNSADALRAKFQCS